MNEVNPLEVRSQTDRSFLTALLLILFATVKTKHEQLNYFPQIPFSTEKTYSLPNVVVWWLQLHISKVPGKIHNPEIRYPGVCHDYLVSPCKQ
jgi:hypothetical protein